MKSKKNCQKVNFQRKITKENANKLKNDGYIDIFYQTNFICDKNLIN